MSTIHTVQSTSFSSAHTAYMCARAHYYTDLFTILRQYSIDHQKSEGGGGQIKPES
jgi:hypothetical protein